jgi:DNA-binding beta-propeller fold protein YncE
MIDVVYDGGNNIYILSETGIVAVYNVIKNEIKNIITDDIVQENLYSIYISKKLKRIYATGWVVGFIYSININNINDVKRRILSISLTDTRMNENKNELYVASPLSSVVFVLDARNLNTIRKIKAGYGVREIEYDQDSDTLFTGNFLEGTVSIINLKASNQKKYYVGPLLRSIYYSKEAKKLFAASQCGVFEIDVQ